MKLLIALALAAAPSGLAMAPYVPSELNGCGEPCTGDVVTIDNFVEGTFDAIEDNKCYEVKGNFPSSDVIVREGVNCAKITVPSGSRLDTILTFGTNTEIVNDGETDGSIVAFEASTETKITNTGISRGLVVLGTNAVVVNEGEVDGVITVSGTNVEVVNQGKVDNIVAGGAGAKIKNTGNVLESIVFGGANTEIVNQGKVPFISVGGGAGSKITNTGTKSDGEPIDIQARPLRPSASEGSRRLPRAHVGSATTDITVSPPGKAQIFAFGGFTFKCYGKDVMARADGGPTVCPEEP